MTDLGNVARVAAWRGAAFSRNARFQGMQAGKGLASRSGAPFSEGIGAQPCCQPGMRAARLANTITLGPGAANRSVEGTWHHA
jgi:hypothetical protein